MTLENPDSQDGSASPSVSGSLHSLTDEELSSLEDLGRRWGDAIGHNGALLGRIWLAARAEPLRPVRAAKVAGA